MELQVIRQKIYEIRGLKVMLDFDLAELYAVPGRLYVQTDYGGGDEVTKCDLIPEKAKAGTNTLRLYGTRGVDAGECVAK
jgi:hypothetical protein